MEFQEKIIDQKNQTKFRKSCKRALIFEKVRVRVRVRSTKIEVRWASACETIFDVRVCVRRTVNFLATQRLFIT